MTNIGNAITVGNVSKVYNVYDSPRDRLKELLSLSKKKYYREFHAVDDVTFEVGHGEMVGIIGRNGSGKSTLLQIICGILKPSSGTVHTVGRISALLELGTGFNPEFTGRENVYLSGALMGYTKEDIDARYQDILDFADIGDFLNQPVKTYSSGMYVRLAFACAVNVDPEILIVDEALSVGDVFFQQKCFRKMGEFKERGKTMLLVSHSLDVVQKNCDRAIFLEKGRLVRIGESRDVINHYLETVLLKGEPGRGGAEDKGPKTVAHGNKNRVATKAQEDRCRNKRNYNKNEFRYGNFKASIVDFSLLDTEGREVAGVFSGGALRIRFEVAFDELVEFPIYGFIVKTKEGVTVYGNNSWFEGVTVEPKGSGDKVVVEFRQNMNLASGDYFISAGVAELTEKDIVPVDRRYDLAYVNVMPVDKSFGVVNLFSKVDVKNVYVK